MKCWTSLRRIHYILCIDQQSSIHRHGLFKNLLSWCSII